MITQRLLAKRTAVKNVYTRDNPAQQFMSHTAQDPWGEKKQSIRDLNIWFISFFASWGLKTTPGPLTGFIRLHYISPVLVSLHILMIYFKAWVGLEWHTGTVCPTWASHNLCTEHTTSFCFLIYGLDVTFGLYSLIYILSEPCITVDYIFTYWSWLFIDWCLDLLLNM